MKNSFFWAIKKCFSVCFAGSSFTILLYVGNGLLNPFMVNIVANIINNIDKYVSSYMNLIFVIIILTLAYMYKQTSEVVSQFLLDKVRVNLKVLFGRELLDIRTKFSVADLEMEENYDMIEAVVNNADKKLSGILLSVCIIISLIIEFIGLFAIISQFSTWVIPAFIFFTLPLVILSFKGGRQVYLEDRGIIKLTRLMKYYSEALSDKIHVNERTLFGFSEYLNKKYEEAHLKRSNANTAVLAKWMLRIKLCAIVLIVFTTFVVISMLHSVSIGKLSLGLFITLSGTIVSLSKRLSQMFSRLIFDVADQKEYLVELNKFFIMKQKNEYSDFVYEREEFYSLKINNLSYKYPNSEKYVLKNLNLFLESGKSYSLIGINGAGKSTLIKILIGIYKDFEGEVLLNDKSISEYTDNQLRNIFSIVYQDYAKYQIPLKDNLTFGQDELWDPAVIDQVGLGSVIASLEKGEMTVLGKIEDNGADLSGGEWQKLVIARALVRKTPFMILDEPTASLSPKMENDFYTNLIEAKKHSTLLLISHRMAASKITDIIIVLNEGRIVEQGSHAELMYKKGQYYIMFESQRRNYSESEEA